MQDRWDGFDSHQVHLIRKVAGYGSPGRFAKPRGLRALRVRLPCLPLSVAFGVRLQNGGIQMRRILVDGNLLEPSTFTLQPPTEGPPDWRREPVGSRSNVKASCGFNSRPFRCGRVRCWFPETDCESVWQRFNSARSPSMNFLQACSWVSSQPPKLTYGVRILTLVLQRLLLPPTWLD